MKKRKTGVSTLFKEKNNEYAIQGGGPNYLGKQPEVKVPRYWKSSPEHPDTELAYITEPEKQVLIDLNLHDGLEDGKPNTGPNGVISLQGDMGTVGSGNTGGNGNTNREQGIKRKVAVINAAYAIMASGLVNSFEEANQGVIRKTKF